MVVINSLIAGPGAIGALVCAQIQPFGFVRVYPHRSNIQLAESLLINESQLTLQWQFNDAGSATPDIIWITCKAFNVTQTTESLLKRYPNARAILLNNGMGPQQALQAHYGDRVIIGSTTSGALKITASQFRQTSFGETYLQLNEKTRNGLALNQLTKTAKPPLNFHTIDDIEPVLWRKLLINACINPLTGSLQIQNGKLLDSEFRPELEQIINEINTLCRATGRAEVPNALETVLHVAQFSQHNWSSMAMDVKQGRKTEIDFINGYLLDIAKSTTVSVPRLQYWYDRIASLYKS